MNDAEKNALKHQIQSNQHEIFVVSIDEMDAIIKSSPPSRSTQIKEAWKKLKNKAEFGASYTATADDLRTLSKLVGDLGGVTARVYLKTKFIGTPIATPAPATGTEPNQLQPYVRNPRREHYVLIQTHYNTCPFGPRALGIPSTKSTAFRARHIT